MAKRFTDTEIWDKEWFMNLSCKHKCLIRYIESKCDVAGVWSPNWKIAAAYIGEPVSKEDLGALGDQVRVLKNGDVFLVGFVEFQCGELSENCKPHQKVIGLLRKHGIYEDFKNLKNIEYPKGIHTLQEEEEEKEEEKEEDKGGVGENFDQPKPPKQPKTLTTKFPYSGYPFFTVDFEPVWLDFITLRNKKKKPLTDRAVVMALNKLQDLSGGLPGKAIAIVDQTLTHSWDTFYELKQQINQVLKLPAIENATELTRAERAELKRRAQNG